MQNTRDLIDQFNREQFDKKNPDTCKGCKEKPKEKPTSYCTGCLDNMEAYLQKHWREYNFDSPAEAVESISRMRKKD